MAVGCGPGPWYMCIVGLFLVALNTTFTVLVPAHAAAYADRSAALRSSRDATRAGLPILKGGTHGAATAATAARKDTNSPAATIHDVPDDLIRLILLRLDSPVWVLRAACACRRFHRAVITDADDGGRAFLRLARSLHPPTVIGGYHPWIMAVHRVRDFVPTPPAPAPIDGGRFSLDWLPGDLGSITKSSTGWHANVADCHGGLVLLLRRVRFRSDLQELIVVDPLTRRHRAIRRPPDEHVGSDFPDVFLLAGDDGGDISVSNFRLLYSMLDKSSDAAYVFSSTANGGGWRFLRPLVPAAGLDRRHFTGCAVAGRIDGALYVGLGTGTVMVLDNASLEFSKVDLPIRIDLDPRRHYASTFTVVHSAGDDRTASLQTVRIVHVRGDAMEVFRRVGGGSSGEWVLEHSIRRLSKAARGLPSSRPKNKAYNWMQMEVMAGGTGFAIVSGELIAGYQRWSFSVDVDTMELQDVPQETYHQTDEIFTYTLPWPRFLRACPP